MLGKDSQCEDKQKEKEKSTDKCYCGANSTPFKKDLTKCKRSCMKKAEKNCENICSGALLDYTSASFDAKKKAIGSRPTVLELEARPEGVTNGPESTRLVSQIISGGVVAFDVVTGERSQVVPSQEDGGHAWGLWFHEGTIFVAGGGAAIGGGLGEVYAYDISTGGRLAACQPESESQFGAFLNDVTVRDGYAYITDFFNGKLMVLDADAVLQGRCEVSSVDLPDAFVAENDSDSGANGIVPFADGLLVGHFSDGSVYYISLKEDGVSQKVIEDAIAPSADGLTLYLW